MRIHPFALIAFAFALTLRIAVPSGWMPMVDAGNGIVLAPCPSAEPVKTDHATDHHSEHKDQGKGKTDGGGGGGDCAFAPLQSGPDLWETPDVSPPPPAAGGRPTLDRASVYEPRGPPAPPPPATGPPPIA